MVHSHGSASKLYSEVCKATIAAEGAIDTSTETFCESSLFFHFSVLFHAYLMAVITLYRYALFITDQEYNEQQQCDGVLTQKTQGVSSASFTTRIFLRKRAHASIGNNQANLSAI
ncbi:hypothetical protein K492DRAFT_183044 [Lichtheimia hyalospora FSU 10163]|nr:hypothetical protein K492DRAFT_183044 [Lichtheimia hyalospora FSU 10163]